MAHLKRQKAPKNWPIPRKGNKFVVKPNADSEKGLPLLIILRDMLKVAQNRREVKKALSAKNILLNKKVVREDKHTCLLFDVITIVPAKKYYRLTLSQNGKFKILELEANEANEKISKVVNKKVLKGKKIQLNLNDGRNFLSDLKCNINDSVLIDFDKNKITKCLELKEKANAMVFAGKHAGKFGVIKKIIKERKMVEMEVNKKKINVLIKQIIVTK